MKTKFLVCSLLFFTELLAAQFYAKLSLAEDGLYSVLIKSEKVIGKPVVGGAQFTITAPFGGFEIGELTSITGEWDPNITRIGRRYDATLKHDYFIVKLINLNDLVENKLEIDEEITLFSFRNIGICTGAAELITETDPLLTKENLEIYAENSFSTFDSSIGRIYNFSGIYDSGAAVCSPIAPSPCGFEQICPPGFFLTLERDEVGYFTVSVRSNVAFPRFLLGAGQVTIVAPRGGLVLEDFISHGNGWNHFLWEGEDPILSKDYFFFGIDSSVKGIFDDVKAGKPIKLFSFKNGADCLGPIALVQPDDPIFTLNEIVNPDNEFTVLDLSALETYDFIATYGPKEIICSSGTMGQIVPIITQKSARSAIIEWELVEGAVSYQVHVRIKETENWEMAERLNTKATKTYFYGPKNQVYEGRIVTYYEDGTQSISEVFSLNLLNTNTNN